MPQYIHNVGRDTVNKFIRYALLFLVAVTTSACGLLSGVREVPISERAKQQLRTKASTWYVPIAPVHREAGNALTFFVAFDGTMNNRLNVPEDEDSTVVAKLYRDVKAPDVKDRTANTGRIAKMYLEGPGCSFGPLCWLDAAIAYSTPETAEIALRALKSFTKDRPLGIEINIVVIGFSRGAATARYFLNLVNRESTAGFLHDVELRARSFAILFDTVAIGVPNSLELSLPPNLELAVHYVAENEARPRYAPILDDDSTFELAAFRQVAPISQRIWTLWVPGAHSDLGDSYLMGVGPKVTIDAASVLARLGLVDPISKNFCPELTQKGKPGGNCRTLDEGLHDSRGLLDLMLGVDSPYQCGFKRKVAKIIPTRLTDSEADRLVTQIRLGLFGPEAATGPLTDTRTVESINHVFSAKIGETVWPLVLPTYEGGNVGYDAIVNIENQRVMLKLNDPPNKGVELVVPPSVLSEIRRLDRPVEVEINLTKQGGPWWFVNGCIPNDYWVSINDRWPAHCCLNQ